MNVFWRITVSIKTSCITILTYFTLVRICVFRVDPIETLFEDLTKPTPKGEEPIAVKYIKSITWFAVIALVLVEIFVSIKTGGGMPTQPKAEIPSLDELSGLN